MKAIQYTIRNIPTPIDRYLRKRAKISGQSLNSVIIQELSENVGTQSENLVDSLDWFIGENVIGNDVIQTLDADDKIQKQSTKKQWQQQNDN
jgi:predicted HicB family RNase H-like nuclease